MQSFSGVIQNSRRSLFNLRTNPRRSRRQGTATVEFAVCLPMVVLLIIGTIEIGRAISVQQTLHEVARAGCRLYSVNSRSQTEVTEFIDQCMANANISGYQIAFDPENSSDIDEQLESVTVSIRVGYENVAWAVSSFMSGKNITASCTMPADIRDYSDVTPTDAPYVDPPVDVSVHESAESDSVSRFIWSYHWQQQYSSRGWYDDDDDDDPDDDD